MRSIIHLPFQKLCGHCQHSSEQQIQDKGRDKTATNPGYHPAWSNDCPCPLSYLPDCIRAPGLSVWLTATWSLYTQINDRGRWWGRYMEDWLWGLEGAEERLKKKEWLVLRDKAKARKKIKLIRKGTFPVTHPFDLLSAGSTRDLNPRKSKR